MKRKKAKAKKIVSHKKKVARRKKRSSVRVRRSTSTKGRFGMEGRRKRRRTSRRVHGKARRSRSMKHVMVLDGGFDGGFEGRRRRSSGRRRRMHGGLLMGGFDKKAIMPSAISALAAVGGGIGGLYLGGFLPKTLDARVRAGIPLLAGIALAIMGRAPALKAMGMGLSTVGGMALAQKFIPNLPGMAGIEATEDEIRRMLSGDPSAMGAGAPLGIEDDMSGDDFEGDDLEGDESLMGDDLDGEDLEGASAPLGYVTQADL